MKGKPCIKGTRVTTRVITNLAVSNISIQEILQLYPYIEEADIKAALSYAALG